MAPRPKLLISCGSRKKEPRYVCLSEAQASHSHRTLAEVSSSTPHPPNTGLSAKHIRKRCLLRVLCPVRRPVTTLDWDLVKDKSFALLPRLGPEINSRACLRVLLRPLQLALCWLFNQRTCLFCISRLETPKTDSGPRKPRPEQSLASPSAISISVIRSNISCRSVDKATLFHERFDVFRVVLLKIQVFSYVTLCDRLSKR
jgi:hypothetical protein